MLLVLPRVLRGNPIPKLTGILMFPLMLLGPALSCLLLTRLLEGRPGLSALWKRMTRVKVSLKWWLLSVGIAPAGILLVLFLLRKFTTLSLPSHVFYEGFGFGILAGWLEEIGWSGFAWPRMRETPHPFLSAIALGGLWCIWHLPVVDYLGSASPHGSWLMAYFLAFTAVMAAIRVLICWVYSQTGSVLLAQAFHASSTGFLVVLSPAPVTPGHEVLWYLGYALILWILVILLRLTLGEKSWKIANSGLVVLPRAE